MLWYGFSSWPIWSLLSKSFLAADTVEQFHENGYFADPQTINELTQYWEDQKNIDSLLGGGDEVAGSVAQSDLHQQEPTTSLVSSNQLKSAVQTLQYSHAEQQERSEAPANALSSLIAYGSSSDEETWHA